MITKSIKDRLKEYYFINPTEKLRVRQIERKVKIPLPSAIRYSKELEKEGFLKSIIISEIKVYAADRDSKVFISQKRMYNILLLNDLIEFLRKEYDNPTLILFGSYSRGEDTEESDIDIYIETKNKLKINLTNFEKDLKRKIQLFNYDKIDKIDNKELANNIINGITLNGFLEVFKWKAHLGKNVWRIKQR